MKEFRLLRPRLDEVAEWISGLSHPFWDYHFTLSSDPAVRPMRLLGETRINEILANVIHPMLVSSDQADWESYKKIRAELSNRRLTLTGKTPNSHCPNTYGAGFATSLMA